jgi:hypothetical protein
MKLGGTKTNPLQTAGLNSRHEGRHVTLWAYAVEDIEVAVEVMKTLMAAVK